MLNAIDASVVDNEKWHPDTTTKEYLKRLEVDFGRYPTLKKMADGVKLKTGKSISTIRALLEYYYATVAVMCIPTASHYNRMNQQTNWLYEAIRAKSQQSHQSKTKAKMAANAERMDLLISSALERFANSNDKPFDFLEDTLREIPDQGTFEGNILQFILMARDTSNVPGLKQNVEELLYGLCPIISSCIFLDMERERTSG